MRDAMQWVHDRTVDGMNAGTDVHTLMREVRVPEHLDVGEGYGKTSLERAGHLGELRRLVPPPLHHRALRRARRRRSRPTWWPRPVPTRSSPRPGTRLDAGEPVAALHLTDIVLAAEPDHAEARAVAAAATARRCSTPASNFWERAWLTRSLERLEGTDEQHRSPSTSPARPSWSPVAPAASATPSPPPSPTPGPP